MSYAKYQHEVLSGFLGNILSSFSQCYKCINTAYKSSHKLYTTEELVIIVTLQ